MSRVLIEDRRHQIVGHHVAHGLGKPFGTAVNIRLLYLADIQDSM
jgi:hypothetical protein